MSAAVYVVGGPTTDDRNDLRHSLRSLANAPAITEAWVVGDVPTWFAGTKMPIVPLPEKFANQRQSLTRFVNYPGAPAEFYLFNDDMWIHEPVDGELPTCRYLRPLSEWAMVHREALQTETHGWDCWQCSIIDTADWTAARTGQDPWLYEAHTPLKFNTARLRDVLDEYPIDRRFVVGEVYPIAGAGGDGHHCGNAKAKRNETVQSKLANPMPYVSASPETWAGDLGAHIRSLFPTPCKFEEAS